MQESFRIITAGNIDRIRFKKIIMSAEQKLDELGIEYGNIVLWEINTRARKRYGQCRLIRNGCYSIDISETIFEANDDAVEEVVLHELIHSCKDCMNHGALWKKYAHMLNEKYGYSITTTGSDEKYGIKRSETNSNCDYKYLYKCSGCGKLIGYHKKGKAVKILSGQLKGYVSCKCGGRKFVCVK